MVDENTFLTYLAFLLFNIFKVQIFIKMIENQSDSIDNKENDVSDQYNTTEESSLSEDQISNMNKFEWPNSYWFIAERTNGRLAMIGFMAVIINYSLFGWIAYPLL